MRIQNGEHIRGESVVIRKGGDGGLTMRSLGDDLSQHGTRRSDILFV